MRCMTGAARRPGSPTAAHASLPPGRDLREINGARCSRPSLSFTLQVSNRLRRPQGKKWFRIRVSPDSTR
jgi:hypothetical protein